jgi:serine/threonine protein kinase/Tfp pilus assembly protein PilF
MTPERWQQIEQLYHAARERAPGARAAFLDRACAGDAALRAQVETLLAYDEEAENFIATPALQVAAGLIAAEQARSLVGKQLSHYEILALLGAGGMGEVYRARDTKLERTVAIKILPAAVAADQERMRRFVREARAASALNHPNVATIYEIGEAEGVSFIAMEYVEGETLQAKIHGRPLETREILEIALQIADALDEAHTKGITHRDIKPANLMLTPHGWVKVLDFGLARITRAEKQTADSQVSTVSVSAPGLVLGTPAYMSPEQALGREVDHRTDLFSLGVVLYEMATGRMPFAGVNTSETLNLIVNAEPEAITRCNAQATAELERIVGKCLEKEREQRYQSARELVIDLRNFKRESETGQARVATLRARLTSQLWLAATVLVMLVVAALGYLLLFRGAPSAVSPEIKSVAVLPLENLSGDPAQEYFADGITESLINNLARIRALKVISRTSVMRYKASRKSLPEIARELNVDAVIEGSVQRSGGRVRVTAQLIHAATDAHLWARDYERDLTDVLKLQSEVARAVADEIRIQVTAEERARLISARRVNPQAHEAYLLGRYHFSKVNEQGWKQAIEYFERAIQIAPDYAAAQAGLSDAWLRRGLSGTVDFKEAKSLARAAALKAIALDEQLAEAHISLGYIKFHDWDWAGAEEELRRALELDPGSLDVHLYYGYLRAHLGRHDEAIREGQIVVQLDPVSSATQSALGRFLYWAHRYEEALPHLLRAVELEPRSLTPNYRLGDLYVQLGRYDEAIAAYERSGEAIPKGGYPHAGIARVYALMGRHREARQMISGLKDNPYIIAAVHVALGDKDEAFRILEKAVGERQFLTPLKVEPPLESLHSDPRWKALLRRMNFPEQ